MTAPVIQRIANVIRQRLIDHRVAPTRNGDVGLVVVAKPNRPAKPTETLVVQQRPSRPLPRLNCPGNPPANAFNVIFDLNCYVDQRINDESKYTEACNAIVRLVVHAITHPEDEPYLWHTFDGLAINAQIGESRDLIDENSVTLGVTVPLTIQYRVAENDHTVVR